jgi:hypothetical protein
MEQTGHYVSGKSISFQAKGRKREVQVILPTSLELKFTAVSKSMPETLPSEWSGFQIAWINNIGLEAKVENASVDQGEYYEIQFARPQTDRSGAHTLVYWDGKSIQQIPQSDFVEISGDKVAVRLQLVDPPVGWGTR